MKTIFSTLVLALLSGCTIGHKQFYDQVAPSKYPPTSKVMVFEYSNVDLNEIYDLLFSDFLVIGKSGFNGPYENPSQSIGFAKSIGADVFITSSQFNETKTSFMNLSTPTNSTTYINAYSGSGSVYGTATTYGTKTTTVPISVDRYDQDGMYLKNVNDISPLWERTKQQYKETNNNDMSGSWKNESYRIALYQSGDQMVAFVSEVLGGDKTWLKDQLKMVYGVESGVGIYLMGDKTPIPSKFEVNKFGHLEVTLLTNSEKFTFAKMP
ncbi:hypothetical protein [Shewanella chilikensis]|uniref:hypothetical protein n=1 Tax=Shewanella chilikensis TaxID=558541 RepID=UPI003A969D3B